MPAGLRAQGGQRPPVRQEQARRTRRAILAAAGTLFVAEIHGRQVDVMIALAGAATADPDAAEIWRKQVGGRRRGMTMFAAELLATGAVRPQHTVDTVADVLWLAMDFRSYDWLVRQRGWSTADFERWYVDSVAAVLFT